MNRAYRLIWQEATRTWVAVAENVRGRRKGRRAVALVLSLAAASAFAGVDPNPNALPTGYQLKAGEADAPKMVGNEMVIDQKSLRAVYGWDSFNIGSNASVYFKQISSSAVAMNLIGGNEASQIYGKLRADGQMFLMNPNGVVFAPGAQIDVGGMLATTMSMNVEAAMDGDYRLSGAGNGKIRNEGLLKAVGSIALVGDTVENAGTITAASVTLAAGSKVAIALTGDGLIRARVENPALRARLENTGDITATLSVAMTAGDAKSALDSIVNNTGTIRATGLVERGGEILLEGTVVMNNGTLDASSTTGVGGRIDLAAVDIDLGSKSVIDVTGTSGGRVMVIGDMKKGRAQINGIIRAAATGSKATDDGGFIETSAAYVNIERSFRVNALSAHGRTGKWLIDPIDFYITAGNGSSTSSGIGADTLAAALGGADVAIATDASTAGSGNIFVDGAVAWSAHQLTLSAHRNIYVRQNLVGSGTASLVFKYGMDSTTGNGANYYLENGAKIYLPTGDNFATWLGTGQASATTYTVIDSIAALQAMASNGKYVLGDEVDASATQMWDGGFQPIANFSGRFDGFGHAISGLRISRPSDTNVGLFGSSSGYIRNVGLVGANISGRLAVGGLVGYMTSGEIENSYVEGLVTGTEDEVGGLVGSLYDGTVKKSHSTATVQGRSRVGGLAGENLGGGIEDSYASGDVTGSADGVGGLVGWNTGGISGSYAQGSVLGRDNVGGLVGENYVDIADNHAEGAVEGDNQVGGLIGYNFNNTVSDSYATGQVTGHVSDAGGLVGKNEGYAHVVRSHATGAVVGTDNVGGLIGLNTGVNDGAHAGATVTDSYATGNVTGDDAVGGLVGRNEYGAVTNSYYATGKVTGNNYWAGGLIGYNDLALVTDSFASGEVAGYQDAGGLVGYNYGGVITGSHASGKVTGTTYVGGLLGTNTGLEGDSGKVVDSYATGIVEASGDYVGGLVGLNNGYGQVEDSYASGSVTSTGGSYVGGLAGQTFSSITRSYASGAVSGYWYVGGLAGDNRASSMGVFGWITDSYATGDVSGNSYVGGLVGRNQGLVRRAYATGDVNATDTSSLGALIGINAPYSGSLASAENSFWKTDALCAGQPCTKGVGSGSTAGANGVTAEAMKTLSTFTAAGWNIDDAGGTGKTWRIYDRYTFPLLRALLMPVTITADNTSKTYDGTPYDGGLIDAVFNPSNAPGSERIYGFSDPYAGATDAGEYLPELYSNQRGYDISYVGARLTIASGGVVVDDSNDTPVSRDATTKSGTDQTAATTSSLTDSGDSRAKPDTEDKKESGDVATERPTVVAIAGAGIDKPADEVVAPPRAKGRALVCKGG